MTGFFDSLKEPPLDGSFSSQPEVAPLFQKFPRRNLKLMDKSPYLPV